MFQTTDHEIIIKNFKSNEIVQYSVIIIHGIIVDSEDCTCRSEEIVIDNGLSFKLVDNKFKLLKELKQGQNIITVKYCCVVTDLSVYYQPRDTTLSVLPLYIICEGHDGGFQAPETENNSSESACKRITLSVKLLQTVFAEKLNENGFGKKTFHLDRDCKVFYSKLSCVEARKMNQEELWGSLGREIANSILGSDGNRKFLAFLSCTRYLGENYNEESVKTYADIIKLTQGYVALGGGALALFGTACLYTWPENLSQVLINFENASPVDRRRFMDDSCYRGTLGACFSTTLGSLLHELCHAFDLGHTQEGIMGRGFDDIYKIFTNNKNEKIRLAEKFQSDIGFKEMGQNKKTVIKTNRVKEEDNTSWTDSCLILLAYHKWFNNHHVPRTRVILKYDSKTRIITSTAGLRVIELRDEQNGLVLNYWIFAKQVLKYSFQISVNFDYSYKILLVVEDNHGNILKEII